MTHLTHLNLWCHGTSICNKIKSQVGHFKLSENDVMALLSGSRPAKMLTNECPINYDLINSALYLAKVSLTSMANSPVWASYMCVEATLMTLNKK